MPMLKTLRGSGALVAALMLALGAAGTAQAQTVAPFDRFTALCVDTDAHRERVVEAATALGWFTAPQAVADQLGGAGARDAVVQSSFDLATGPTSAEIYLLASAWGGGAEVLDSDSADSETCLLSVIGGDTETLRARLRDLFGFEPATTLEGDAVWLASREGSGFRSEAGLVGADGAQIATAVRDRRIFYAFLIDEEVSAPGLMFGALIPR